jgi:YD repeat-containing protein
VTTTGPDGAKDTTVYNFDPVTNLLTSEVKDGTPVQQAAFDQNIVPGTSADGNGNTTTVKSNPFGEPLSVTNALTQTSLITYTSTGLPITVTDTLGRQTALSYDTSNNLTQVTTGITSTSPLSQTTHYTYNVRYPGKNWLEDSLNPTGVDTHYDYNNSGQVTDVTAGYGTSLTETTGYGYDSIGRVITTTVGLNTGLARSDVTRYNADNTIAKTIQNYQTGAYSSLHPDQEITTESGQLHGGPGRTLDTPSPKAPPPCKYGGRPPALHGTGRSSGGVVWFMAGAATGLARDTWHGGNAGIQQTTGITTTLMGTSCPDSSRCYAIDKPESMNANATVYDTKDRVRARTHRRVQEG